MAPVKELSHLPGNIEKKDSQNMRHFLSPPYVGGNKILVAEYYSRIVKMVKKKSVF